MSLFKQLSIVLIFLAVTNQLAAQCPVIPQPQTAAKQTAIFQLSNKTAFVVTDKKFKDAAYYLQQKLLEQFHIAVSMQQTSQHTVIRWQEAKQKDLKAEGYNINMSANEIVITANDEQGAFYAAVSLLQLFNSSKQQHENLLVDCWNITDAPLYGWRGLMLDESRHFYGKEKVKSILDWMAFYKLNRFHWHLTDEPGWRLEIKKYPLLTLVGGIGNYTNAFATATFYTQEDVREIVRYAAERNIVVIPEIDMPGHATAANKAYPQYSGGGSDKHPDFTFHPAKEETYSYLTTILRETNALFPSGMLHLGGDEVSFGNEKWAADPLVQALMKKQNLATVNKVEQYFMQRIADSVFSMHAKVLAWDEVAESGLPVDKTILFWWRHDQPKQLQTALSKGYDVVLCPRLPLYFDFVQDSTHTVGRKWGGKLFNPLKNVYDFAVTNLSPVSSSNSKQVLGIQANVWTEAMQDEQRLDYMLFPRIAALAEAAWTSRKNFDVFSQNLTKHFVLYRKAGINYYHPVQTK
ncbi:beta-hexosaminidase [Lacibacter luteus]|uniref:beta-N-acetylhexosaminidase n=1 Tax=Lacibacter luteus TaxID=2508719 RepID=A0A4Q1CKW9_9BACT|nr:beta-N-acetylhexosaminidase [Lacibacter luteus]RXK61658.1 beta-hexosaminidase [Lacibacter luteus]